MGRVGVPVKKILPHAAREQHRLLGDDPYAPAQLAEPSLPHVDPVHAHPALLGVEEAGQ